MSDRNPIAHAVSVLVLVLATTTLALELATVTASLARFTIDTGKAAFDVPLTGIAHDFAVPAQPRNGGHSLPQPVAMQVDPADTFVPPALPPINTTGPWNLPLYHPIGVPLWDRIRASSPQERRSYLLGTAIQVHTPATAATPGPRPSIPLARPARGAG